MRVQFIVMSGFSLLALGLIPRSVQATCAYGSVLLPAVGSQVPTNTRIWSLPLAEGFGESDARPQVLEDCSGKVLELSTSELKVEPPPHATTGTLTVYTPVVPLQPNTKYCSAGGVPWFETLATAQSEAPAPPVLTSPTVTAERLYDSTVWPGFFADFDGLTLPSQGLYLLNRMGEAAFDAQGLRGTVQDASATQGGTSFRLAYLNACGGNWPDAALGSTTTVSLGYLDLAGNFSGWSNPITVTAPAEFTPEPGGSGGAPATSGTNSGAAGDSADGAYENVAPDGESGCSVRHVGTSSAPWAWVVAVLSACLFRRRALTG